MLVVNWISVEITGTYLDIIVCRILAKEIQMDDGVSFRSQTRHPSEILSKVFSLQT